MQDVFQHLARQCGRRAGAGPARRARAALPGQPLGSAVRDQGGPSGAGGCTVVCIASGPSLTADDCQRVGRWKEEKATEQRLVVVVNESWRLARFAHHLYAADGKWWRHTTRTGRRCIDEVRSEFPGQLWTCDHGAGVEFKLNKVDVRRDRGLATAHGVVNCGASNGGMQAVNLAWHLGATRIVLLGYDMTGTGHWHGLHVDKLGDPNPPLMQRWAAAAAHMARDLIEIGVEVANCSRITAAQGWPRVALEDVLV